jgi:hypothetical protein
MNDARDLLNLTSDGADAAIAGHIRDLESFGFHKEQLLFDRDVCHSSSSLSCVRPFDMRHLAVFDIREWVYHENKGVCAMQLQSTVVCPECSFIKTETMPTDSCRVLYQCLNCGVMLRPKSGDCCVFCSYGTVPCPPKQEQETG